MDTDFIRFEKEVVEVERRMASVAREGDALVREVAEYIRLGRGKMLRARLLMLVASQFGELDEAVLRAAACVELVHTASLLHDDVIDSSFQRRGRPSINARFGQAVAILMADLLYGEAFDLALAAVRPEVMRRVAHATRSMCESELFQIEKNGGLLSEDDYLRIIRQKTAVLFSASAEIGGLLGGAGPEACQALARFGLALGMAFQIADDNLDLTATSEQLGKPAGHDLAQGTQTLPLLYCHAQADEAERRRIEAALGNGGPPETLIALIEKYEGIAYAQRRAEAYLDEAVAELPRFAPDPDKADPFRKLCRLVLERRR